jgi:hypothetical protein
MRQERDIIIKVINDKENIKISNRRLAVFFAKKYAEKSKTN